MASAQLLTNATGNPSTVWFGETYATYSNITLTLNYTGTGAVSLALWSAQGTASTQVWTADPTVYAAGNNTITVPVAIVGRVGLSASIASGTAISVSIDADSSESTADPIQTTTQYWVDCNRTDSYTATGSISNPFPTLASALAAVTGHTQIIMAPGSYTETVAHYPAQPLVVFGNGSTLTLIGATQLTLDYTAYDLNVVAPSGITYAGAAATTRFILRNGSRKGPMTVSSGFLDAQACTQTWNSTSDQITVTGTGNLLEIGCINTLPVKQQSATSIVFVENCNWNTSRATTYLLESSAGQMSVANTVIVNSASVDGGGIYIHNSQTNSLPNIISGCFISAVHAVTTTTGVTLYSKVAAAGSVQNASAVAVPDLVAVSVGQVSLPNLSQGSALTLATTTAPNIKATGAFTLTLPAASSTYQGMAWTVSSAGYAITYSGTFKYSTAKGTWTAVSASTYAAASTSLLHYIYCDGSTWLVSLE